MPFWLEGCGDFKDEKGWVKVSAKGNKFRMTAEQLLNPLLPAIAGVKPGIKWKVEYKHEEDVKKSTGEV